jgi:calcium-binding protein CML
MSRIRKDLTDEEIEEFQELFNMADTKKRGRIYTKDVKYILSLLGMNLNSERFIFLLKEIEYDYSGSIDFGTFIAMMAKKIETKYTPDKLHKAFAYLDITQTGVVSTKTLAENIGIYHKV